MQGPQKYPMIVEKFANDAEAALRMENWTREKKSIVEHVSPRIHQN